MSFLRAVVADARPRRGAPAPEMRQQLPSSIKTAGLNQDFPQAASPAVELPDQASRPQASPKIQDVTAANIAEAPVRQKHESVRVDVGDGASGGSKDRPEIENTTMSAAFDQDSVEISIFPAAEDATATSMNQVEEPATDSIGSREVQAQAVVVESTASEPAVHSTSADAGAVETGTEGSENKPDQPATEPDESAANPPKPDAPAVAVVSDRKPAPEQIETAPRADVTPSRTTGESEMRYADALAALAEPVAQAARSGPPQDATGRPEPEPVDAAETFHASPAGTTSKPVSGSKPAADDAGPGNRADEILFKDEASPSVASGTKKQQRAVSDSSRDHAAHSSNKIDRADARLEIKPDEPPEISKSRSSEKKSTISSSSASPAAAKPPAAKPQTKSHEAVNSVAARVQPVESTARAVAQRNSKPLPTNRQNWRQSPDVQIGQIDVIVEMPAKATTKPAAAVSTGDLASRHYLRRL